MEHSELDIRVDQMTNQQERSELIDDYKPFILKIVSNLKNAYVSIENDEEYSIGLIAFDEAIKRYKIDKGHFLGFAKLVIESRLKNFWQSEARHQHDSIDNLTVSVEDHIDLKLEIEAFEKELQYFGLDFDLLIDYQPKHMDTRTRAIEIGQLTGLNKTIMTQVYSKRRLPVTLISRTFNYSVKIIKTSKFFILATSLVFYKNFENIINWIK